MGIYILYALIFISVILVIEAIYLFVRSKLSGEAEVNRRIKMINKSGREDAGLSLLRHHRNRRNGNSFIAKLDSLIWAANIQITPTLLLGLSASIFALAFTLLMAFGLDVVSRLLVAFIVSFLPLGYVYIRAQNRRKKFNDQLIGALDLVSRGLQAGHPAAVALEIVAKEMPDPIGTEFGLAIDEINYGLDRNVALRNLNKRFPSQDMQFFSAAMEVQRETGGNLVEVLDNLTKMMRDRKAISKKVKAMSAEGRVTGIVVGILPVVIAGIITLMMPNYYSDHFGNPNFFVIMTFPLVAYVIGLIWMKRLVSIKV